MNTIKTRIATMFTIIINLILDTKATKKLIRSKINAIVSKHEKLFAYIELAIFIGIVIGLPILTVYEFIAMCHDVKASFSLNDLNELMNACYDAFESSDCNK